MKIRKYTLALIACMVTLINCNDCDQENLRPPLDIVFCDFTSSVDSVRSINKIKNNAIELMKRKRRTDRMRFYTLTKDAFSPMLFESIPLINCAKKSEERRFDKAFRSESDSLRRILDIASTETLVNRNEPNSCIINCISRGVNEFKNYSKDLNASLNLYILSDMLECCEWVNNEICIEDNNDLNSDISKVKYVVDSAVQLTEFTNLNIYIILVSNVKHSSSMEKFKKFWNSVFRQFGYKSIPYYSDKLPE